MNLNWNDLIPYIAALLAAGSFLGFVIPMLQRTEKKERYKEIIEKRRKDLFENARDQTLGKNRKKKVDATASQSVSAFFRVERMIGDTAVQIRDMLLQAGIRNPMAPLFFVLARVILPLIFIGLAMMFISKAEKELSNGIILMIFGGCAVIGFYLPKIMIKNNIDKRQQEISLAFPDALDMMLICVQGGIGIEGAINRIADEIASHSATLAEEMGLLSAELGMLNDRKAAFQDFARRVGSGAARSFATAMIQAEQYGTSVSQAMRVLADDQRDQRMAAAEQKAASLPPKLTVPMIVFFLPTLFIVILGPAGIQAFAVAGGN